MYQQFRSPANLLWLCIGLALCQWSCNKKCRSLENSISGAVVSTYDFKDCFVYATLDSTLSITSDTAFTNYKNSHFIHCDKNALAPIDFSKHALIGFKTSTSACNVAFHRDIAIDTTNKVYTYTVTIEKCNGCGTALMSPNFVVGPQIPAGYAVKFIRKEK